jgi:hypothetical protein
MYASKGPRRCGPAPSTNGATRLYARGVIDREALNPVATAHATAATAAPARLEKPHIVSNRSACVRRASPAAGRFSQVNQATRRDARQQWAVYVISVISDRPPTAEEWDRFATGVADHSEAAPLCDAH